LATARHAAIAASLKQVMAEHNVRFINASFGSTALTLATEWSRTCGGAAPSNELLDQVLHVYDPIYDLLFNTDGVIAAHAAANLGSPFDYPFDPGEREVSQSGPRRLHLVVEFGAGRPGARHRPQGGPISGRW